MNYRLVSSKQQLIERLTDNLAFTASDIKAAHYHDDEVHIRQILEASGLVPKGGMDLAAATIRGLILTVSHQGEIGELYPQVLETLVHGACKELFD